MIIRAVTLFYPVEGGRVNVDELRQELMKLRNVISNVSKRRGIEIRTWRVTLPFTDPSWDFEELSTTINKISAELGYIHASLNIAMGSRFELDKVINAFIRSGSYLSIWVGDFKELDYYNTELFTSVLRRLVELNQWALSRRMAALIGAAILTPYYPDSVNLNNSHGIALSILYPSGLSNERNLRNDLVRVFGIADDVGKEIANELSADYLGIDASLSPWGEESVVDTVERIYGIRFGGPGTLGAIYKLNKAIWEVSSQFRVTGFNEVMLPLAEDEKLKARTREGLITFSKLVKYTTTCVAGVDMVPIPSGQVPLIRELINDLHAIASIKRRSIGLRLIPYPGSEAEVDLGDFGRTPLLDMMR
ncbi:DUF711 family protein [Vulcanisaeta souniana]|uniref:DUF711 family protein n=1 Tax=Vulcanisaeta souniana JCM 11219 TaxID=1293586 RepID=A0A830E0C3_9CREN|nr:DUF711 family protein [Vulcanisaeta souniana]BDR91833.1 hypothetical protein Vsou_09260 [Vulcanisaeta souniana JCM 11219]GGI69983.1 hypothetical protein GCM10007112_03720 [Vulcanisaeta souniana JCM 11219]